MVKKMNNINEIKLNVLLKILNEEIEKNSHSKKANYLINEIIEICDNDLMNESIKKKILSLALLALPSIMTGCSVEEAQEAAAAKLVQSQNNTEELNQSTSQGIFGAEGSVNTERSMQAIESLKNKWDLVVKDLQSVNVKSSPAKKHALYLSKLYDASSKIFHRFDEFKDNKYLMSVFVTSLFASDRGLYQSIGRPVSKGGTARTEVINSEQRFILFYEYVVENKEFYNEMVSRSTPLSKDEMKRVKEHPLFNMYSESIEKIKKTAGSGNITLWLTSDLSYYIDAEGDKSFWCGAFVGAIYKMAFGDAKGNIEGIPMSAFASTVKMMKYAKNKNIAIYSDDFMKKNNASEQQQSDAKKLLITEGMIVLYKFDDGTGTGRQVVAHFGIATSKVSPDGTFTAIEGNTSMPGFEFGYTGEGDAASKRRSIDNVAWIIAPPEYFTSAEAKKAALSIKELMTRSLSFVFSDPEHSPLPQDIR